MSKLRNKILTVWWQTFVPILMRRLGVELGLEVKFFGTPIVSVAPGGVLKIGSRAVLCSHSRFTALGVSRPVILRVMRNGAEISVGSDTGMSGTTICAAQCVRIGSECLIGADVMIADNDFHPSRPEGRRYSEGGTQVLPVIIHDNVFIGARSVVMKGVTIGKNSVIGAGSVVVRDIPENCIAAGNPARVVKKFDGLDADAGTSSCAHEP